ncbi:hypothetical protein KOW79_018282 [Hemibagrus wyckioides]|uniref:Uncharacterized protein n=1 Tax=Hemibagrus wyckioides TaxID=337641 RepID=A0A9D3NCU2_9TELE|nr:hypothetical protein KOW79_018282 [Hemibagrus wyckioides]
MHLCPPLKSAKHDLKIKALELLLFLQNESICAYEVPLSNHTVRCLNKLQNNNADCELASIFGTYFTEATKFDIHAHVTEGLLPINQYLHDIQDFLCKSKSEVKDCGVAFEESDGDYEKICKVMSLLKLLRGWLSREHC